MGMFVAKIIGCILILLGCSGLGIWYCHQLQVRILHIKEMIRILDLMNSEIQYSKSTLPECFERISEKSREPYKRIFLEICTKLQEETGISFPEFCAHRMKQELDKLPLKGEREIFIHVFEDTDCADSWLLRRNMERGKEELQGILNREEEETGRQCSLALRLGIMSGMMLVLILI